MYLDTTDMISTTIALFGSLFILLLLSLPIGFAIGGSTILAVLFFSDMVTLNSLILKIIDSLHSFPLLAIPFFILAGILMTKGGISKRLLDFSSAVIGGIVGSLAYVTVVSCMFFAAISGSGPATVAAIGSFMIPEMDKSGYPKGFGAALTAVAGSLGAIIPPSISFIVLGVASGVSIGDLFLAGVVPGILAGLLLIASSYLLIRRLPGHARYVSMHEAVSLQNIWNKFLSAIWALLTPIVILGGIYGGFFTPTEAAAVAVLYAIVVGGAIHRDLTWKSIYESFVECIEICGALLYLIAFSFAFSYLLTIEEVPVIVADFILSLTDNVYLILLLIIAFLLVVGCFVETVASILILTPILFPIAKQIGLDPIHFGVIFVFTLTIGYCTPPVGVNLFVASAVGKISFEELIVKAIPFVLTMIVALAIITFVPSLSTALPAFLG